MSSVPPPVDLVFELILIPHEAMNQGPRGFPDVLTPQTEAQTEMLRSHFEQKLKAGVRIKPRELPAVLSPLRFLGFFVG